jgi:hypothetical protein
MASTYRLENVSPEILDAGLAKLKKSGFTVEGNDVKGMGVEATYAHEGTTLTVTVEKQPPFLGSMIESQIRGFFA